MFRIVFKITVAVITGMQPAVALGYALAEHAEGITVSRISAGQTGFTAVCRVTVGIAAFSAQMIAFFAQQHAFVFYAGVNTVGWSIGADHLFRAAFVRVALFDAFAIKLDITQTAGEITIEALRYRFVWTHCLRLFGLRTGFAA